MTKDQEIIKELVYLAHGGIGIYPAAWNGEPRSDWKTGHNEGVMKAFDTIFKMFKWYESLSDIQRISFELMHDSLFAHFDKDDKTIKLSLNMNDTFAYACADSEEISLDDLVMLKPIYEKFGQSGLLAYVSKNRDMQPIKEFIDDKYLEAIEYFNSIEG